jgi:hypothetical protein
MIYQYSWNMCLFIKDITCGSCMTGHHFIFSHCHTATEPDFRWAVDRTWRPSPVACTISWPQFSGFLAVRTRKYFGVFSVDQRITGIRAASKECLSGDSSETRNFRQSSQLCVAKNWKLCWNAWEQHTASAVKITPTSPLFQQALVSAHTMSGTFFSFKYSTPLKIVILF